MPRDLTCPKCRRSMEKGVVPDMGHGRIFMSHWQQGRETGLLGGLKREIR